VLVVAGLIVLLLRDWWLVLPGTLAVVALALFAALAAEPVVRWAARRGVPRGSAVAALGILAAGVATLVVLAVVPAVGAQVEALRATLPAMVDGVLQHPSAEWLQAQLGTSVDLAGIVDGFIAYASDPQQSAALWGGLVSVSGGAAALVVGAILTVVLSLYLSLELPAIRAAVARSFPRSRRDARMQVVDEISDGVGRYVAGQVALATANAVVALVVVTAVGGPTPALFAVIAFLAAFLPVVGTPVGYGIATTATFTVSPAAGIVAGIVLVVYMLVEAYVLVPAVMKRAVRIPASLVIISALVGAAVGGIPGAFFAVPITGALLVLHRRLLVPAQERR
jgi:predicted PurR-regulated permease PerM